jgi:hypothetical protein
MRTFWIAAPLALAMLAGCQADPAITTGALGGAAIGAIAAGDGDRAEGALLGAVAGGALGAVASNASKPKQCRYQNPNGSIYVADCPPGY